MKLCRSFIILLFIATSIYACSENDEEAAEPNSLKAMAEEIGHEAAKNIQQPIDKAHLTVDQENQRLKELEKRLNE